MKYIAAISANRGPEYLKAETVGALRDAVDARASESREQFLIRDLYLVWPDLSMRDLTRAEIKEFNNG